MPQQAATIENVGEALELVKAMEGGGLEWDGGYRPLARQALAELIEGEMVKAVDRHLPEV